MISKLQRFFDIPSWQKWVFLRAWFLLGYTRVAIHGKSFKHLVRNLEHHSSPRPPQPVTPDQQEAARQIGTLVTAAAKYTPWQSRCLVQVLVVQRLLDQRNIPGQFYLGVRRGREQSDDPTGLSAHAWLQCGQRIVNGAAGYEQFTVVSAFSWGATSG